MKKKPLDLSYIINPGGEDEGNIFQQADNTFVWVQRSYKGYWYCEYPTKTAFIKFPWRYMCVKRVLPRCGNMSILDDGVVQVPVEALLDVCHIFHLFEQGKSHNNCKIGLTAAISLTEICFLFIWSDTGVAILSKWGSEPNVPEKREHFLGFSKYEKRILDSRRGLWFL